jgi:hypothetical protein
MIFNVVFEGVGLDVHYCPPGHYPYLVHFAFHSTHEPPRLILVSNTDYLSYFVDSIVVDGISDIEACTLNIPAAIKAERNLTNSDQLSLL